MPSAACGQEEEGLFKVDAVNEEEVEEVEEVEEEWEEDVGGEEGLFKADAVNEEDSTRDHATLMYKMRLGGAGVRAGGGRGIFSATTVNEEDSERDRATREEAEQAGLLMTINNALWGGS